MTSAKPKRNRLVVIGGPTATGKTALAVKVAKEVGGEIVSADARQIYRGMDVGTGKGLPENIKYQKSNIKNDVGDTGYYEISGVRVWLYDVVAPDQLFSAAAYRRAAWPVVEDIWRRGEWPLVVGGTGFYIKSLLRGLGGGGVPPDWALRKQLEGWTAMQLAERLRAVAPDRWGKMNASDRGNPRRLIRAIELSLKIGNETENKGPDTKLGAGDVFSIGLTAPYPYLYRKIDRRVEGMLKAGLLGEVENLIRRYGWAAPGLDGIGYRQWRPYFEGKSSLAECVQRIKFDTHAYIRRQMTWFKREPNIVWFDVSRSGFDEKVLRLVKSFR